MTESLVTTGTVFGNNVRVDATSTASDPIVWIQLTTTYTLASSRPRGLPLRPFVSSADVDPPRMVSSGNLIGVPKGEADALIALGAAMLA